MFFSSSIPEVGCGQSPQKGNEYIYPGLFMSAVNNPGLCYQLSDFFNK